MCNQQKLRNEELILYRLGELEKSNKEYQKEVMKKLDNIEKRSDELHEKQIKQESRINQIEDSLKGRIKKIEEGLEKKENNKEKYKIGIFLAIIGEILIVIRIFLLGG